MKHIKLALLVSLLLLVFVFGYTCGQARILAALSKWNMLVVCSPHGTGI
jgi:hypothetical protein